MMTDVLTKVVTEAYLSFATFIQELCDFEINIESLKKITVVKKFGSIYHRKCLPPLFSLSVRLSTDEKVLNQAEITERKRQISEWNVAANGDCTLTEVSPIFGHQIEYDHPLHEFKNVLLTVFETLLLEFGDISHIRKFVMDRVYFPVQKTIGSVDPATSPWLETTTLAVVEALDGAIVPVERYLLLFQQYESFLNTDNAQHIAEEIKVTRKDQDSTEIELPLTVNLNEVTRFLNSHLHEIQEISNSIPCGPLDCGLFILSADSIKHLLLDKHRSIIHITLSEHSVYSREICKYVGYLHIFYLFILPY